MSASVNAGTGFSVQQSLLVYGRPINFEMLSRLKKLASHSGSILESGALAGEDWLLKEIEAVYTSRNTEYAGLLNLGATCYVNAMLQSLFTNVEFRALILEHSELANASEPLQNLGGVFKGLERSQEAVNSRSFIEACALSPTTQEDTHELVTSLLEFLEKETGRTHELFSGTYVHETTCQSCLEVSRSDTVDGTEVEPTRTRKRTLPRPTQGAATEH